MESPLTITHFTHHLKVSTNKESQFHLMNFIANTESVIMVNHGLLLQLSLDFSTKSCSCNQRYSYWSYKIFLDCCSSQFLSSFGQEIYSKARSVLKNKLGIVYISILECFVQDVLSAFDDCA